MPDARLDSRDVAAVEQLCHNPRRVRVDPRVVRRHERCHVRGCSELGADKKRCPSGDRWAGVPNEATREERGKVPRSRPGDRGDARHREDSGPSSNRAAILRGQLCERPRRKSHGLAAGGCEGAGAAPPPPLLYI